MSGSRFSVPADALRYQLLSGTLWHIFICDITTVTMLLKEDGALQFSAGLLSPDRPFEVKFTENHLTAACRRFLVEISDLLPDLLSLVLLRLSSLEGKLTSVNNKRSYSNQSYLQEY